MQDAQNGEWERVWERIDKKSQAKMEVGLEMLAGLASAFDPDSREDLKGLSGRELFVRIARNRQDVSDRFTKVAVKSCERDGERATLKVTRTEGDATRSDTVYMLWEDGTWKMSIQQLKPSSGAVSSAHASTQLQGPPAATANSEQRMRSNVSPPANPDFRNVKWGMPMDTVKALESAEMEESSSDTLMYVESVGGLGCLLYYEFVDNKLALARYIVTEMHVNNNQYLSDYNTIKDSLTKKHGQPSTDETFWSDDLYKDDRGRWGTAVVTGRLSMFTTWKNADETIILMLTGEGFKARLVVEYTSKTLHPLLDQRREAEQMKKF